MEYRASFTRLDHIGILTKDLEKTVYYLQSLGIGPFKTPKNIIREDTQLYGKPVDPGDIKLNIRMAEIGGGTRVELIQPIGEGPWQEYLDKKGDGIHHLAFAVDDVINEGAKLTTQGAMVLYRVRFQGGGAAIYLDTSKFGDIVSVIELVKWPPGMILD